MIRPVLAEILGSWPSLLSLAQMSAVRRSCQTMARCTACPVARSHTTVVSRWLVMPIAAMSFDFSPAFSSASRQVAIVDGQHKGHGIASRKVCWLRKARGLGHEGQYRGDAIPARLLRSLSRKRERED